MANTWKEDMQKRFETLERKIDGLTNEVTTLGGEVTTLSAKVTTVDAKITTLDSGLTILAREVAALEDRLSRKTDVQMEEVRELVRISAEGYASTLEFILRELTEFRAECRTRSKDIDLLLANHERRITTLEQRPS